uniref:Alpha/beta hydrolase fold-3 domain-containing protein n=1 Tax=Bionectria ochroleuca TaxID=29856 RepID=A0A8H7MYL7_BIOOC
MAADPRHEALQPIHPSMAGKLDPVFEKLYNDNVANTPLRPIDLDVLRSKYSVLYSYGTGPAPDVAKITDAKITTDENITLDIRVYQPEGPGPWPAHIDYHGGGWGLGDLDTESHICKHICKKAGVLVIDVAYRLVPENAFPCGVTDSFAALKYVYEKGADEFNILPQKISVGGVSAGGFISLAIGHMARDAGIPLRLIAVGTPVIDDLSQYAAAADSPFPPCRRTSTPRRSTGGASPGSTSSSGAPWAARPRRLPRNGPSCPPFMPTCSRRRDLTTSPRRSSTRRARILCGMRARRMGGSSLRMATR